MDPYPDRPEHVKEMRLLMGFYGHTRVPLGCTVNEVQRLLCGIVEDVTLDFLIEAHRCCNRRLCIWRWCLPSPTLPTGVHHFRAFVEDRSGNTNAFQYAGHRRRARVPPPKM